MITKASRVAATLALAAALTTSGCAIMSPVQTDMPYQASDGINLDLGGDLAVRGLVVVGSTKSGGGGRVAGQFVNKSDKKVVVTFATSGASQVTASVPAYSSVNLADKDDLTMTGMPAVAGQLVTLKISTSGTGDNLAQVPVVSPERFYADYKPAS
ncbi:MAG TPA: hypothetical protein PLX71_04805 [Phycicoccus sp.]|nr:hypothetical protein [Phycicoccus sp.]